ncbi:MAG: hypothetical protein RIG82_10145 [Phycisphaeraceae bacterium]
MMLSAVPLVLDGFAEGAYLEGAVVSATLETVDGFSGVWGGSGTVTTEAGSLGYAGFGETGDLRVELADNALVFRQFDPTAGSPLASYVMPGNDLGASVEGNPLYFSFLWQVTGPSRPAATVSLYKDGTTSGDRVFRVFTSSSQPTFQVAVGPSTAGAQPLGSLSDGVHLFVVRVDFAEGDDTLSVWQDPVAGSPEPAPQAQFSYDLSFDRLALSRFGGSGTVAFDEWRMGETWSSVTDPGSLVLLPGVPLSAEGFANLDYPAGSSLDGIAGYTPGYDGSWATLGSATLAAGSLSYPGYGEAGLNRVVLNGTDVVSRVLLDGNNGPLGNYLAEGGRLTTSLDGSPLYLSFLLEVSGLDAPLATFSLYDGGVTQDKRQLRIFSPGDGQDFRLLVGAEASDGVALGGYSDDPQLFVLRVDFAEGADTISVWQNPDLGLVPGQPDAVIATFDLGFDRVAVTRFQGQGSVAFDELRLGSRWADVVLADSLMLLPDPEGAIFAMAQGPESPYASGLYPAGFFPFIDPFGQYRYMSWPEKVTSSQDLADRVTLEAADLLAHPGPGDFNVYGGWASGPQLTATGYFRTEKLGDRWWLVDPEGRLFFSHGLTGVSDPERLGGGAAAVKTGVTGREHYFAGLPLPGDPAAEFLRVETSAVTSGAYQGSFPLTMNFYASNALERYGSDWEAISQSLAHDRLRSWGMNTIGGFSDEDVYLQSRTPYTIVLFPPNASLINGVGTFPDYFDPQYRTNVINRILEETGKSLSDPWLLGYFVHNELSWTRSSTQDIDVGLAALASAPTQHAKVAFRDLLMGRYGSIGGLNSVWQTDYASWEDLLERRDVVPGLGGAGQDLRDFDRLYAERYFETTASAMTEAAPEHLYLGARFTNGVRIPVAEASASRVDVLSINRYGTGVDTLPAALTADVPIIISEFHFSANDTGLLSDGLREVADQAARAQAYSDYLETAMASDRVVGVHWLQYWDFPTSGRLNNSNNNSNLGFVTITDTPYDAMVEAARGIGSVLYETRGEGFAGRVGNTVWIAATELDNVITVTAGVESVVVTRDGVVMEVPGAGVERIQIVNPGGEDRLDLSGIDGIRLDLDGAFRLVVRPVLAMEVGDLILGSAGVLDLNGYGLVLNQPSVDTAGSLRTVIANGQLLPGDVAANVGYATASDVLGPGGGVFLGIDTNPDSVLIRPTYDGDTNLDGVVDLIDLSRLANSFGTSGSWMQGDSNHDGVVDLIDLSLLAGSFGQGQVAAAGEPEESETGSIRLTGSSDVSARLWQSSRASEGSMAWQDTAWLRVDDDDSPWFGVWTDQPLTEDAPVT